MMVRTLLAAIALIALLAGCGGKSDTSAQQQASANTPAQGQQAAPPSATPASISGEVTETMDSGGYTYVHVKTADGDVWAAGPTTEVAVGDEVTMPAGMVMKDFASKTLDRTFPEIYFVNAIQKGGASNMPASMGGGAMSGGSNPHSGLNQADVTVAAGSVAKAAGGVTVAEIHADAAKLAGKQVLVRGQVVKRTGNVMGKNWLHIQDGSSNGADGDLTVTTDGDAKVGDVVLIKGTVATNKDFGAGYAYDVIVENATVTRDAL